MARRKLSPNRGSQARPLGRSLRDQVKALLSSFAPVLRSTAPPAEAPGKPASQLRAGGAHGALQKAGGPSFKELAADVLPLPEPARPVLVAGPVPSATLRVSPKTRLWVEQRDGEVGARAEGVPVRLLEDLRAGRVVPRVQIDLHRRSAAEARQLLDEGVSGARKRGVACLLVVCGRGTHSGAEGPVLPEVAIERLSEVLAHEVLAFCTAPRKWGGQGALIVRLRAPATSER
jgi:DNA-nicking Smr family endonuclease